jgi:hypothetical protein
MGMGAKVIGIGIAGIVGVGATAAYLKSKAKGTSVAPGTTQEVGQSGTSWLLEFNRQTYGSMSAMGYNVYAAPGTQYTDDSGASQIAPTYLPVLLLAQVGDDKSTRSLMQTLGPKELVLRAVADLGIQSA